MKNPFASAHPPAFQRILSEIQNARLRERAAGEHLPNPAAAASFPFLERAGDAEADWQESLDYFTETAEPAPVEFERALSDSAEAIASDLGLELLRRVKYHKRVIQSF